MYTSVCAVLKNHRYDAALCSRLERKHCIAVILELEFMHEPVRLQIAKQPKQLIVGCLFLA